MKLTPARHTALARLSDGEWRLLSDTAPTTIAWLQANELIRDNMAWGALQDRLWTITPDGLAALKGAGRG